MALFGKESLSGALGKAKELAGKATEAAKTGIDQTRTMVNEKMEQSKQSKLPQEGGLIRYEVTYNLISQNNYTQVEAESGSNH